MLCGWLAKLHDVHLLHAGSLEGLEMATVFQHCFMMTLVLNKHWNIVISYQSFLFYSCRQLIRIISCLPSEVTTPGYTECN